MCAHMSSSNQQKNNYIITQIFTLCTKLLRIFANAAQTQLYNLNASTPKTAVVCFTFVSVSSSVWAKDPPRENAHKRCACTCAHRKTLKPKLHTNAHRRKQKYHRPHGKAYSNILFVSEFERRIVTFNYMYMYIYTQMRCLYISLAHASLHFSRIADSLTTITRQRNTIFIIHCMCRTHKLYH